MNRYIWIFNKYYIHGYIDWVNIFILFTLLTLPLIVKFIGELGLKFHIGYFIFIFIAYGMFTCSCPGEVENATTGYMFLAFPIGYSIYCIRREKTKKTFAIVVLVIFSFLISLGILSTLPLLIKTLSN